MIVCHLERLLNIFCLSFPPGINSIQPGEFFQTIKLAINPEFSIPRAYFFVSEKLRGNRLQKNIPSATIDCGRDIKVFHSIEF